MMARCVREQAYFTDGHPSGCLFRLRRAFGSARYASLFFSSRRRHTRVSRDWRSDVCSSDLHVHPHATPDPAQPLTPRPSGIDYLAMVEQRIAATQRRRIAYASLPELAAPDPGAGTHDPAATLQASTGDATGVQTAT